MFNTDAFHTPNKRHSPFRGVNPRWCLRIVGHWLTQQHPGRERMEYMCFTTESPCCGGTVVAVTLESGTKGGIFLFVELSFHSSRMSSTERQARCSDDTCQCVSRNHAIEDGQRNMMIKMESLRHLLESLSTTVTTVSRDMASLRTSMSRIESRLEMDATTTTARAYGSGGYGRGISSRN